MSELDLDIALGTDERSREDLVRITRAAEAAGVHGVWFTEGVGRDVFGVLTQVALATDRIALGTGIVNVFARTPTMIAQCAASVLEIMKPPRRFYLGLGTSGRALVEKAYGVGFERSVTRLAETVQIIDATFRQHQTPPPKAVLRTESFPFGVAADRDRLRIYTAGLGARSLRITGEYADGWLPIWPSRKHLAELRADVDRAAADAGRRPPEVAGYLYGAVGDDDADRQAVRDTLAWYVAGNGSAYRHLFERYGYNDDVARIAALWTAGRRDDARRAVPDHLLDDTAIIATPEDFLSRVESFRAASLDRVVWRVPRQIDTVRVLRMLEQLAAAATASIPPMDMNTIEERSSA